MTSSSVTLIGPGSIGGALAAGLVEAGHMPTIVVRTPFDRLQVEWPDGSVNVDVACVADADDLDPADIVIVATKATQNDAIAAHVRAATGPGSILIVAQNGIDLVDRFAGVVAQDVHILPAVVMLPASRTGPGQIKVGGMSRLIVPAGEAADAMAAVFDGSFVEIEATEDWLSSAWFKLIINAASGGIGVLIRRGTEAYTDPDVQALLQTLMEEVAEVGRAEGATIEEDLPSRLVRNMAGNAGSHMASIVVDRINGVPTEWRERNEVVVRVAEKHGIDVPLNRAVTTLIRMGEPAEGFLTEVAPY